MKLTRITSALLLCPVLLLNACSDDSDYDFDGSISQAEQQIGELAPAEALFDAATGALPSPNNLAFAGSEDGTLNIPIPEGTSDSDPRIAMNTLDGFSTIEPISTSFSRAIDPASLVIGETVRVFETTVDPASGAITGIVGELGSDQITASAPGGTTLAISPLLPLKGGTNYMFIVTSGVTNEAGVPSSPSAQFRLVSGATPLSGDEQTKPLEPLRLATFPLIEQAQAQGIPRGSIILAWSMRTQSTSDVLATVATVATGVTPAIASQVSPSPQGLADLRAGTLELPYYRTAPASVNDPVGISSYWTGPGGSFLTAFNPMPVVTSTQTVPLLLSTPSAASGRTMPEAGWPVALYVHGINGNRKSMVALADRMAVEGFAVVAIDHPMHGITDSSDPLYAGVLERTFNLDLINNDTQAPGPDGQTDPTGTHYYSLTQLLASRDNLRQSAADLLVLSKSVGNITAGSNRIDGDNKTLIGHSLGGVAATTFLAFDSSIRAATLAMPAAGLSRMLIGSGSYGPILVSALEAAGLQQGSADFERFLTGAQTVIDSGDSINHGAQAAANAPIHMVEIVGDGADNASDQTVPNSVTGAPLAGTEALARVMNLGAVSVTTDGPGLVRFNQGAHSSLLDPTPNQAVFNEIQSQLAIFASNFGTRLQIDNESLIQGN